MNLLILVTVFSLTYWFYIYATSFIIHLLVRRKNQPELQGYAQRVQKVEKLISSLGFKFTKPYKLLNMGFVIPLSTNIFLDDSILHKLSFAELEYAIYHEAGHLQLNHPNKLVFWFLLFLLITLGIVTVTNHTDILTIMLLSLVAGNIGRYIARLFEDQADEFAYKQIGFEKAAKGIRAFYKLNGTGYDFGLLQGYFDLHRSHLARIDRLRCFQQIK